MRWIKVNRRRANRNYARRGERLYRPGVKITQTVIGRLPLTAMLPVVGEYAPSYVRIIRSVEEFEEIYGKPM